MASTLTVPTREDWLAARRTGIGGSDAPAILGLSSFKTPYQVFLTKRGDGPAELAQTSRQEWGQRLEPAIRQAYADATGQTVRLPTEILRHPKYPWMLGTIDGFTDAGRLVEIKRVARAEGWGDPWTDEIPEEYLVQVQHYLAVTGFAVADVAALIGIDDFRIYQIDANDELQQALVEAEQAFWQRVLTNDPPDPMTLADVKLRWQHSLAKPIPATEEIVKTAAALRVVKGQLDQLEAEKDILQTRLCAFMGECDTLVDPAGVLATWKRSKDGKAFDKDLFEKEHPALYATYQKPRPGSRRFLLK